MDMTIRYVGRHSDESWPPGLYYTDASGGPNNEYPVLRRCGVGVACIDTHSNWFTTGEGSSPFLWGAYAPLTGVRQSVPRAELYAIFVVISHVGHGEVTIKTDSKINVDLYDGGKEACMESDNVDIWLDIWQILQHDQVRLKLSWVKGHADNVHTYVKFSLTPQDLVGNLLADVLAGWASRLYQVWKHDAYAVKWYFATIQRVQARAVVILSQVLGVRTAFSTEDARPARPRPLPIGAHALSSQHTVRTLGWVLHCVRCLRHSPAGAQAARSWLASPCRPDAVLSQTMRFAAIRPTVVPRGTRVVIGRATVHESHELHVYRGLYYCRLCGYHGSAKMQKLVATCTRLSGRAAIDRVLALKRGRLPSGLREWPNEKKPTPLELLQDRT